MVTAEAEIAATPSVVRRWLTDHRAYAEDCLKIRTKLGKVAPLRLNRAQEIVHDLFSAQRRQFGYVKAIILKARQEGISTYVGSRNYRGIHLRPNRRAVVIAHERDAGSNLYDMYQRFDTNLPPAVKPSKRADARGKHIIYDQLSTELIVETAGNQAAGRSSTIHYLHISEFAFWKQPDLVYTGLMGALAEEDSEVVIESTANGVGGAFHDLYWEAVEGANDYLPIFLPWWIHGEYVRDVTDEQRSSILTSQDEYERQAQDVGFEFQGQMVKLTPEQLAWRRFTIRNKLRGDVRKFQQEYPTTDEEAFLTSGAQFFDPDSLKQYVKVQRKPLLRGKLVEVPDAGVMFTPDNLGHLRVWELPHRWGRYVVGADPAEGKLIGKEMREAFDDGARERGGRDYSCAWVFDVENRKFVASLHGRMAPEVFADELALLGWWYNSVWRLDRATEREAALIGVENNAAGASVLSRLRDVLRFPNLYYRREINRRTRRVLKDLGWHTGTESRKLMLDDLAAALRLENIELPDPDTLREMRSFTLDDDGKPVAENEAHDDRIIAAAIALQIAKSAPEAGHSEADIVEIPSSTPSGAFDYGWEDGRDVDVALLEEWFAAEAVDG